MKNSINKLLAIAAFGLILSSSTMAAEEVDAFTLSFQNNNANTADVYIIKASYTPGITSTDSVLDMCYDSVN